MAYRFALTSSGIDNPQLGHEKDTDRQFKGYPEGQKQFQRERKVFFHGEHRPEGIGREFYEKTERRRQGQVITECHPSDKQQGGRQHKGGRILLTGKKSGGYEFPDLIQCKGAVRNSEA